MFSCHCQCQYQAWPTVPYHISAAKATCLSDRQPSHISTHAPASSASQALFGINALSSPEPVPLSAHASVYILGINLAFPGLRKLLWLLSGIRKHQASSPAPSTYKLWSIIFFPPSLSPSLPPSFPLHLRHRHGDSSSSGWCCIKRAERCDVP